MLILDLAAVTLAGAVALSAASLFRGKTMIDRALAFELLALSMVAIIAYHATRTAEEAYLNLMLVWAILSFLGTAAIALYLVRDMEK